MNYHDNNITVIHQPSETMKRFILGCLDDDVLSELLSLGTMDTARGNVKIDTGFASGMCQKRDKVSAFISCPDKLVRTNEPMFIRTMLHLSTVMDMVCKEYSLPFFYQVDGIEKQWATTIHPDNLMQQTRNSIAMSNAVFGPHLATPSWWLSWCVQPKRVGAMQQVR